MKNKIHFKYDPNKEPDASFASSLIEELGQIPVGDADQIVSIGGDGLLLQAMRHGAGKTICGVVPPDSNSLGFWTNRNIYSAGDLLELLNTSARYNIKPLEARVGFHDGSEVIRYGYNDITIQSVHSELSDELREEYDLTPIEVSEQSMLVNLRASFSKAVIGPVRIMGTGLIFATPLGSTGMSRNFAGPAIDIRHNSIVLTGIGTTEPVKGFSPVVVDGNTKFNVDALSSAKRPLKMTFDSFGIVKSQNKSAIAHMSISMAHDHGVELILNQDPGTRTFSTMMPRI